LSLRELPFHELAVANGLRTNFRPEENPKLFLLQCQNMETFGEFNSLGQTPGSTRVSAQHSGALASLHYFEYNALTGPRTRESISLDASGTLRKINADLSLTTLTTGLVAEPLCAATMLDRIHFSSRNQLALTTGGLKYDGSNVRPWGVVAPGARIVVKQAIDSASDFTGSTDVTKSTDTSTKKDTVASVRVDKTGTATTEAYIERSGLAMDVSDGGDGLAVWLFIPGGALQKLATSGTAIEVRMGGASLTNSSSFTFGVGRLIQGWNLLTFNRTAASATTGTGATFSTIVVIRFRIIFSSSAQTQTGFRWDRFYGTDSGKATAAVGAATGPTGQLRYRVTYLTENGLESNAGAVSNTITVTNQKGSLTGIPVSQDSQVIARRIYRDLNLDSVYLFVTQIDNNVDTTFTDSVLDASLGSGQPPLAGDTFLDNSPPEPFRDCVVFDNRIYAISAVDGFTVLVSNVSGPEAFPIVNQLQFEEDLIGISADQLGVLVYSTEKVFVLVGDGTTADPFRAIQASDESGLNGFRAKAQVKGQNLTVRKNQAFFLQPADPWFLNYDILDLFTALDESERANMHIAHDRARFRVVFFARSAPAGTYDRIFVYQYGTRGSTQIDDTGGSVDAEDLRKGSWRTMSLPSTVDPRCSAIVERTATKPELWVGGGDGYVYWIGDPSAIDWAKALTTELIDAIVEFSDVPIGRNVDGRGEPRFLKTNGVFGAGATWTTTITLLTAPEGEEIANVSFTTTYGSGSRSPVESIPPIGAHGEWVRVKLRNNTAGEGGTFRSVVLSFIPRVDFRGTRSAA
jgi:hypothetical protein